MEILLYPMSTSFFYEFISLRGKKNNFVVQVFYSGVCCISMFGCILDPLMVPTFSHVNRFCSVEYLAVGEKGEVTHVIMLWF